MEGIRPVVVSGVSWVSVTSREKIRVTHQTSSIRQGRMVEIRQYFGKNYEVLAKLGFKIRQN